MRSIAIWVIAVMLSACATAPAPRLPSGAAIDAEAQRLMADERVVGMAVAVMMGALFTSMRTATPIWRNNARCSAIPSCMAPRSRKWRSLTW